MSRYLRGIMRTAAAAMGSAGGIRLNRTAGLTEYLQSTHVTSLSGSSSQGTWAIWFRLHAISGVQCIYTSLDNRFSSTLGARAWVEVDGSGNMYGYYTVSTGGGNSGRVDLATGITANTWYCLSGRDVDNSHNLYLNGVQVWSGTTQLGFFHRNFVLGARKYANAAEPGSGGQLTGLISDPYFNFANATYYEVLASSFTTLNAAVHAMIWNGGNGLHPLRSRLAGLSWNHYFNFEEARLSGGSFTPVVGTLGMSLVQSSFQSLVLTKRLGTLVY